MSLQEFSSPSIGLPPKQSPLARFIGLARGFALNTVALSVAVFVAEKVLAPEFKPSVLIGGTLGKIETEETRAKQEAVVEFNRRNAEAQAAAQARAAIETEISRKQQEITAESLTGQSAMANLADWGCILGQLVPRDASDGWQSFGAVARSGCGASARIRQNMVQEQARAGRQGGSIQDRRPDYSDLNRDPDAPPPAAADPPKPKRFRPYGE